MPGKVKNMQPCFVCREPAQVKQVRPKRYADGRHRCPPCHRQRVTEIVAYWTAANEVYTAEQNRGGISLVGVGRA